VTKSSEIGDGMNKSVMVGFFWVIGNGLLNGDGLLIDDGPLIGDGSLIGDGWLLLVMMKTACYLVFRLWE